MKHLTTYKLFEGRNFKANIIPNPDAIDDINNILIDLEDEGLGVRKGISSGTLAITIYKLTNGVQTAFNINSIKDVVTRLYNYTEMEGYRMSCSYSFEMIKNNQKERYSFDEFPDTNDPMELIWHFTIKIQSSITRCDT